MMFLLKREMKQEMKWLMIMFLLVFVLFRMIFYRDAFMTTGALLASWFWLFVLPGFALLWLFRDRFLFLERFIIAVPLSGALVGIPSYYLGLAGVHSKLHVWILPLVIIVIAFWLLNKEDEISWLKK